jgi:hypothetical protein
LAEDDSFENNVGPENKIDNMSCDSWYSSVLSFDDDHPLVAFEAEATPVILEGFMKYRQKQRLGILTILEMPKTISVGNIECSPE